MKLIFMMCFLAQCFGSLFCVCHEVKVRNLFCWVHYMLLFFFLQLECQSHLPKQHAFKLTMENVHKCIRPKIVFGNPFFCEIEVFMVGSTQVFRDMVHLVVW